MSSLKRQNIRSIAKGKCRQFYILMKFISDIYFRVMIANSMGREL